jgi:hypothetical protein
MATLEHLCATGKLKKHIPDLEDTELPQRMMYFAPEFEAWISGALRLERPERGRNLTPFEQAELICYEFIVGRPMGYGYHYKKLDPISAHAWELKTEDVRIFGWFAMKSHFVAVGGELKRYLKRARQYGPHVLRVTNFRNALELDEPKAITGVTHNAVL